MKTIRLLYPDHVSGGLDTYYFGAMLLQHILPKNPNQPLVKVDILPPDGKEKRVTNGIYAEDEVLTGIQDAQRKIAAEDPDRIVTVGGNCMVSLAPFDYLHGKYENVGIIWIDAHPDVSTLNDGYPNAHAMVLGSLLGQGAPQLVSQMRNPVFKPSDVLYIGLQQHTIDAQENPYEVIVSNRLYEQQDYIIETNHVPHLISLIVSEEFYKKLSEEDQKILREAEEIAKEYAREKSDERISEKIREIEESGTEIITPDEETREQMKEASAPVYDQIEKVTDPELFHLYTGR